MRPVVTWAARCAVLNAPRRIRLFSFRALASRAKWRVGISRRVAKPKRSVSRGGGGLAMPEGGGQRRLVLCLCRVLRSCRLSVCRHERPRLHITRWCRWLPRDRQEVAPPQRATTTSSSHERFGHREPGGGHDGEAHETVGDRGDGAEARDTLDGASRWLEEGDRRHDQQGRGRHGRLPSGIGRSRRTATTSGQKYYRREWKAEHRLYILGEHRRSVGVQPDLDVGVGATGHPLSGRSSAARRLESSRSRSTSSSTRRPAAACVACNRSYRATRCRPSH